MKPSILTFSHYYLPGFKSGGPVRTIANMVDHLSGQFQFKIVSADRDSRDTQAYQDVAINDWNRVGNAQVYYVSPDRQTVAAFTRLVRQTPHDILYLNSFFDPAFTLKPLIARHFRMISRRPTIIAPRGELSTGALSIKSLRKRAFLAYAYTVGLYRDVHWQASDYLEYQNIKRVFGANASVMIAPDLPTRFSIDHQHTLSSAKRAGAVRLLFLGRISPIKNLLQAIRSLNSVRGEVEMNIYGPVSDAKYWQLCQTEMQSLPANVRVAYHGSISRDEVPPVITQHHALFLPSQSENYGHSIVECLTLGLPVIIGRETPWRGLTSKRVGFDCDPDDQNALTQAVNKIIHMDSNEYGEWSRRASAFGQEILDVSVTIQQNRELFNQALHSDSARS